MRPSAFIVREALRPELAELPGRLCEAGFDVRLVPHLYHLPEESALWGMLAALEGPAVFLLPLHPRPIEALLRRHQAWRPGRVALDLRAWDQPESLVAELRSRMAVPSGHGSVSVLEGAAGLRWYPVVDEERCTHCGSCHQFCLFGVYELDERKRVRIAHPDRCKPGCPACSRICPQGALMFPLYAKDAAIAGAPGQYPKPDAAARKMFYARTGLTCPACGQAGKPGARPGAPVCGECGRPRVAAAGGRDELDALLDGLEHLQEGR